MERIPEDGLPVTNCRFCNSPLTEEVADLGSMPPANDYVPLEHADIAHASFPLKVMRCTACHLVQVGFVVPPRQIFEDYAYFSSYSSSWVEHARRYAGHAMERFGLDQSSFVLEIGSNDGYLLQHFVKAGVPVLGIDPAANVVEVAREKGVPTRVSFFDKSVGIELAQDGNAADLIVANNVYAHVPDVNSFTEGLRNALKPEGVISIEFPHLLRLLEETQFDTIYHEHYSYYSLLAIENIFAAHGLRVFDIEELKSHGGSLRIFGCLDESKRNLEQPNVDYIRKLEAEAGLHTSEPYDEFSKKLPTIRAAFNEFLADASSSAKRVVGYSAPAKGNTFLNYCGVTADDIEFVADLNPAKQNHLLPGSRIPIRTPEDLYEAEPDYVVILAWNLKNEIGRQLSRVAAWGGQFVVGIPLTEIFII